MLLLCGKGYAGQKSRRGGFSEDNDLFERQQSGSFEQWFAQDNPEELCAVVCTVIRNTIKWPRTSQSLMGPAGYNTPRKEPHS